MAITKIGKTSSTYKQIVKKEPVEVVIGAINPPPHAEIKTSKDMWDILID